MELTNFMKKMLIGAVMALSLPIAAYAGNLDSYVEPVVEVPVTVPNWSGPYIGVGVGVTSSSTSDYNYNGFVGYRGYLGQTLVGGVETSYQLNEGATDTSGVEMQLGLDQGDILPYLSVGYEWDDADFEGNVYGLGLDFMTSDWTVLGLKVTEKDYNGSNGDTTFSLRYSFKF